MARIDELEDVLKIKFKNPAFLKEALTHRSYLNENPQWPTPHNERLEYLGDAVLELATTEFLFHAYPDYPEGKLTSLRAALVNYQMLAAVARDIQLDRYLFLSRGEMRDVHKAREVIMANAIEALIGACYLDQGYVAAKELVGRLVLVRLDDVMERGLYRDPKSVLQETAQERFRLTPTYRVLKEDGPDHEKTFSIGVCFGDRLVAEGTGGSKQEAEANAAEHALAVLSQEESEAAERKR